MRPINIKRDWPEWAIGERTFIDDGTASRTRLRWVIDVFGRFWVSDGAMYAWVGSDLVVMSDCAPAPATEARALEDDTREPIDRFVDELGGPLLFDCGAVVVTAFGLCFDARRALLLEEWFPEPARWGVRKSFLVRCDPEGNTLAVLQHRTAGAS